MQFGVAGRVLGWLSLSLLVFQNAVVVDALELDPTQPCTTTPRVIPFGAAEN